MKRSQPLRPGTKPLRRGRGIRPVNRERLNRRRAVEFGTDGKVEAMRARPCDCCGAAPPCDAAHVLSRAAGGTAEHLVSLKRGCHIRQHAKGWMAATGWPAEWWLALAARIESEWQARAA